MRYTTSMFFVLLFFCELLLLFFLSRLVTQQFSFFIYRMTRSQTAMIYSMAFLFFPGTVLHEISHFLMAGLLFVPVGQIEFIPKIEGSHVKLGSVQIAQTDIFRRFLIGAAPFLFGTLLLLGILSYAANNNLFSNTWFIVLMGYLAFEIGNTMFSSKKDMEGALELLAVVLFFGILFYFLGLRFPQAALTDFFTHPTVMSMFQQGSLYLLIPLGINALFFILLYVPFLRKK